MLFERLSDVALDPIARVILEVQHRRLIRRLFLLHPLCVLGGSAIHQRDDPRLGVRATDFTNGQIRVHRLAEVVLER